MCDSIAASGAATRSGRTLFGKNSDRKPGECQPFLHFAEAWHAPGARVRCTHIEIDEVPHSFAVMGHSPWWVWGFEHGVNQHAVAIGNHSVFTNEPLEERAGLIGMDLVRLALERASSARAALDVIVALVAEHGQGGAALAPEGPGYHNSFLIADPREVWVLETSNRRHAARRVELGSCTNQLALGREWDLASAGVGDFAGELRNPHIPAQITSGRARRARELLDSGRGAHDLASFSRILRDHDRFGETWRTGTAPADEQHFTLCAHSDPVHRTTASLLGELPMDRERPWPVFASFGTPCTGLWLPLYLDAPPPAALARGGSCPGMDSAWGSFEALGAAVARDPGPRTRALRAHFAELEAAIESWRAEAEAQAAAELRAGDRDGAAKRLSELMERCADAALASATNFVDSLGE
jgi:dipeptidase